MAFNVRIFGHRGLDQMPVMNAKQFSADSVHQLVQPYEWRETVSAGAVAVSSSAQAAPDQTQVLRVEVPDGSAIRYEINPPGRAVVADVDSPILSGINHFYFRQGYTISMIDASTVAA